MSDSRDIEEQLKITDADGEVSRADRTEAGVSTGSTSADTTGDNMGVLGDVAHPFDQTNGILDSYDETHPGDVTGDESRTGTDAGDSYLDDDTRVVPPPLPPARP
jgi:hypothetical protein